MKKKRNLWVIPTDKPSRLILQSNNKFRLSEIKFKGQIASGVTQNIYITNDEEIKEGNYVYSTAQDYNMQKVSKRLEKSYNDVEHYKKIILTTDQDLINDRVQAIDDEFLEWFVKNPSCERVEVEKAPYDGTKSITKYWGGEYKIIIPKEEPKQETLEEAAENHQKNVIGIALPKHTFIAGAKWQQERSYSEEEMFAIIAEILHIPELKNGSWEDIREWFEQYKKK